jgi:uncharacterized protein
VVRPGGRAAPVFDTRRLPGYHVRLMLRLPEVIEPQHAADRESCLEGDLPLAVLPRLAGLLARPEGSVHFRLEFFRDDRRRVCIRGRVRASVPLTCQRCLEPVAVAVDSELLLAVVAGPEEARRLPDTYDPLLTGNDGVVPAELLTDEIILALPYVPRHPEADACGQRPASPPQPATEHPFRLLAELKQSMH